MLLHIITSKYMKLYANTYNYQYQYQYIQFTTFTMPVKNKPYTDKRLFSFFERLIPKV